MPDPIAWRDGELWIEEVPAARLAADHGTPLYVYSRHYIEQQYRRLQQALAEVEPRIHFALKSNGNLAIVRILARLGAGADIVSGGELERARRAGVPPAAIVFAGVGKTVAEIRAALCADIGGFTVESEPELKRISDCAIALGRTARIAIRVNPDVDPDTHVYTTTGRRETKFGVDLERAARAFEIAATLPGLEIAGLHMHLGSPLADERPYAEALDKVAPLCRRLAARFSTFRTLDLGGGFGIPYRPRQPEFPLEAFAAAIVPRIRSLGLSLAIEPGRFLTGNAGVLLTTVQYVKDNPLRKFVIVDAGMNDLIRPPLYSAWHDIRPVRPRAGPRIHADVVGPVCESGDFLGKDRHLPPIEEGDLLAVMSAGAYGMTMASNYNGRGRPAEVLVDGARTAVIRERETTEDLVRGERIPDWLAGPPG
ncbi:MAG: diaminopimelate decarboxylase [Kiritimatiellae bacterium]|nr:diaminopimelate decarboxylase [Kiritimatiellia bacterium]